MIQDFYLLEKENERKFKSKASELLKIEIIGEKEIAK